MTPERWRPVWVPDAPEFSDHYLVSDHGRVRSRPRVVLFDSPRHGGVVERLKKGKFLNLRPVEGRRRYVSVTLTVEKRRVPIGVHVLVALAFHRKGYQEGFVVRHKDDDTSHNFYKNLEWGTQLDNVADRQARNRQAKGSKVGASVLTERQVRRIKLQLAAGVRSKDLAESYNVHPSVISGIKTGKGWKHVEV